MGEIILDAPPRKQLIYLRRDFATQLGKDERLRGMQLAADAADLGQGADESVSAPGRGGESSEQVPAGGTEAIALFQLQDACQPLDSDQVVGQIVSEGLLEDGEEPLNAFEGKPRLGTEYSL
jgi:hypothetical protein